jgi:hypothetical protein
MAKTPQAPRRSSPRKRGPDAQRKRSHGGRIVGAVAAVGGAAAVYTGLAGPSLEAPVTCGGSERWNVKVAKDADALTGKVDLNPKPFKVSEINQQVQPGAFDAVGRMEPEKRTYTVRGYLSFFTKEDDRDYHVVITQQPAAYANGKTPPAGQSVVVEFPYPSCFGGKPETQPHNSALGQSITEARATFKDHVKGMSGGKIAKPIPVTVTGIGFFDRFTAGSHEPKGHSKVYALPDGRQVVLELHPVTEITFDNEPDNT